MDELAKIQWGNLWFYRNDANMRL